MATQTLPGTRVDSKRDLDDKIFNNCRTLLGANMGSLLGGEFGGLSKSVSIEDTIALRDQFLNLSPIQDNALQSAAMDRMGVTKSAGGFGDVQPFFEAIAEKMGIVDMLKEIDFNTFTNVIPSQLGFNMFDLSGPARMTYPFLAPFRNRIPREQGVGPAASAKVITGVPGSGTGGMGEVSPFFKIQAPLAGGNPEGAKGNPISYAQADIIVPYKFMALYDSVMWTAFWAGRNFQDLNALSATVLMQVMMMMEDRALLRARDTALAVPGTPTLIGSVRSPVGSEVGILDTGGSHTKIYAKVTAVGSFGETAPSAALTITLSGGVLQCADITWSDVDGAEGYNIYCSMTDNGGADGGDVVRYFHGFSAFNKFTIGANGRQQSGRTVPLVDTGTGDSDAYRGIMPTVEFGAPSGTVITGYTKRVNAKPTGNSISFLQDAAFSMYDQYKADPEELFINVREGRTFSDLLQAGNTAPQRITIDPAQQGGVIAGVVVTSWYNESTGRLVKMTPYPWMRPGNALLASWSLPFPTAEGDTNTVAVRGPQDYVQTSWPPASFRFESSISQFNAPVVYGPTFFGVFHGIAQNDEVTTKGAMQ